MHHTILMPRFAVWRLAFTLVLLLSTFALSARAQQNANPPTAPAIVVPLNTTKLVEMSGKQIIKEVRSDNPNVVSIAVDTTPRSALLTARNPGNTRIFLVDEKGNEEFADIVVPTDAEQKRQEVLRIVRRTVPTANIDIAMSGPKAIVSGTVGSAESVPIINDLVGTQFGGVGNVVNAMRIAGVQQVKLDVMVASVNRSEARALTFNFLQRGSKHTVVSTVGNLINFTGDAVTAVPGVSNVFFSLVNGNNSFFGFLQALRGENVIKVLAQPSVTTMSGKAAWINSGGETPTITSSSGGSSVNYVQFGTVVNCLPIVMGDGRISLDVKAEIKELNSDAGVSIAGINPAQAPGFTSQAAQVSVQMEDGQTLAIGGLIQTKIAGGATKIPILGDLPFVGAAFRSMTYKESEEELLILVTPRLVHPFSCCDWPKYVPGQETRSPDDFELFLEGILEAPRGPRTPCQGGRYEAAHRTGPSSVVFPCCDNGKCGPGGCHPGAMNPAPHVSVAPQTTNGPDRPATTARVAPPARPPQAVQRPALPATQPAPQPVTGRRYDVPVIPQPTEARDVLERPDALPEVPTPPPALGPVGAGEGPGEAREDVSPALPLADPEPREEPQ